MPAQIFIPRAVVETIFQATDEDVMVVETANPNVLDVWVMDEGSLSSNHHRSLMVELTGEIISDQTLPDTSGI